MSDSPDSHEQKLQGKTLQVYLYLARRKQPVGIREVQRDLGLSSPSVAEYQIEKLVEMGIAHKDAYGRTHLVKRVKVKALSNYVELGAQIILPRLVLYAIVFSAVSVAILLASWNSVNMYGLVISSAAACIFWLEAFKNRKIPFAGANKVKNRQGSEIIEASTPSGAPVEKSHFWISLAPGVFGLAAFAGATVFLFYYSAPAVPDSRAVQMPPLLGYGDDPAAPPPLSSSSPSVDYSVEMSAKKVEEAGTSGRLILSPAPELYAILAFASALVIGFLAYLIVRYRCTDMERQAVLPPEQMRIFAFGKQDYPAR